MQCVRWCCPTQYASTLPTPTTDRQCSLLTVCEASEYEAGAPTATSDRVCAPLTPRCGPLEYDDALPTTTSDRICRQRTLFSDGGSWVCLLDDASVLHCAGTPLALASTASPVLQYDNGLGTRGCVVSPDHTLTC